MFKDKYYYIRKLDELIGAAGVCVLGILMLLMLVFMSR
jgi:hypothetical protein